MIEEKIRLGLSHDILLVTGGMSMGERDFVPGILRRLGGDLKITKLRIKPGKPFVFAEMPGGKFVFGLPGNPVSAFVCTVCLVSRLVRRMAGGPAGERVGVAPISQAVEANGPRAFFQPAIFDGRSLTPLKWKGSADIFTLSRANCCSSGLKISRRRAWARRWNLSKYKRWLIPRASSLSAADSPVC